MFEFSVRNFMPNVSISEAYKKYLPRIVTADGKLTKQAREWLRELGPGVSEADIVRELNDLYHELSKQIHYPIERSVRRLPLRHVHVAGGGLPEEASPSLLSRTHFSCYRFPFTLYLSCYTFRYPITLSRSFPPPLPPSCNHNAHESWAATSSAHSPSERFATDFISHFSSFSPFLFTRFDTPLHYTPHTHLSILCRVSWAATASAHSPSERFCY
jgi:hypothetical protein